MRAIDHMSSEEIDVLKLKGMLPEQKMNAQTDTEKWLEENKQQFFKDTCCTQDEIQDARIEAHIEAQEQAEDEEEELRDNDYGTY